MNPFLENIQGLSDLPVWFLALLAAWILIWKGLALWKAAKRNSPIWFFAILIINAMGILEILYFYLFSEMKFDNKKSPDKMKSKKSNRKKSKINLANQKAFLDS